MRSHQAVLDRSLRRQSSRRDSGTARTAASRAVGAPQALGLTRRWWTSFPSPKRHPAETCCAQALKHSKSAFIDKINSPRLCSAESRRNERVRQPPCLRLDQQSGRTNETERAICRSGARCPRGRLCTSPCSAEPLQEPDVSQSCEIATEEPKTITKNHFRSLSKDGKGGELSGLECDPLNR
jgi:hypothetical protein